MTITAIYKLPAIKCTFLIFSDDDLLNRPISEQENEKKRQEIEHILKSKDCKKTTGSQLWKCIAVEKNDFLKVLEQNIPRKQEEATESYQNPENLELLSINLFKKSNRSNSRSYHTPKILSSVKSEDIIEVFI